MQPFQSVSLESQILTNMHFIIYSYCFYQQSESFETFEIFCDYFTSTFICIWYNYGMINYSYYFYQHSDTFETFYDYFTSTFICIWYNYAMINYSYYFYQHFDTFEIHCFKRSIMTNTLRILSILLCLLCMTYYCRISLNVTHL